VESRAFGRSGLHASVIGLGTWPIGGARYGPSDDRDALAAIAAALDRGITCFDTAPSYGNGHAEELLGRALGARRHDTVVVTKGGLVWNERSQVLGRTSRRETLTAQLEASLRRLRTGYVDLFLIHWPDAATPFADVMETLERLVEAGKARHTGVSNFTGEQLRACAAARPGRLVADQISLSLFDRRWARDVSAACADLEIGIMAYGPLAHGLLTGTLRHTTGFDNTDWRKAGTLFGQPLLAPGNLERNLEVVDRLAAVARRCSITLPQLALAWVLSQPQVTTALVGARTPAEVDGAAGAAGVRLPDAAVAEIETIMRDAAGLTTTLPV